MSTTSDKFAERVAVATQRLAARNARQLARELRAAHLAKKKMRREHTRRRIELGGAVFAAHCEDLCLAEIVGLLLDAKERMGASPTIRLALRKKGQEHLAMAETPRPLRAATGKPSEDPKVLGGL